jgi:hypothetical protein
MFKFETLEDLKALIEEGELIGWSSYMTYTQYSVLLKRDGRLFELAYTKDHFGGIQIEEASITEVEAVEIRRTDYNHMKGTPVILPGPSTEPV